MVTQRIPTSEPTIRVGIILPEDEQTHLDINLLDPTKYQLVAHTRTIELDSTSTITRVEINNDGLLVTGANIDEVFPSKFTIQRKKQTEDQIPKNLIQIHPIVAGRSFHWRKIVTAELPGNIEFNVRNGFLMVIDEVPLEQYLMCVATSEMSAACPTTFIETQTIVARSWFLAKAEQKHSDLGIDVCNDDCCQRYQGAGNLTDHSVEGTKSTYGQVLMYDGEICDARYSKSCGGMTERFENVWKGESVPYLSSIPDMPAEYKSDDLSLSEENKARDWIMSNPEAYCSPRYVPERQLKKYLGSVDEECSYYRWSLEYSQREITDLTNRKLSLNARSILGFIPERRGASARLIELGIRYINLNNHEGLHHLRSEYEIRQVLHPQFLYSSALVVIPEKVQAGIPGRFKFAGAGWGHGVGMCQIGALGMAQMGHSTNDILTHYYPGSSLNKIYS
ncbi:MAG: SpoIID/LytB domain-containing protein [Candidatus Marinimicrobia bacterium]|nr:SpoIID/LytB domain-containing protein [Candidatus Neomarinimicrobiota bacterium]